MYKGYETFCPGTTLTDLDKFINAASVGDLEIVKDYIKKNIHQEDKKGDALYAALKHGHTDCIIELKFAIVKKSNFNILSRHYYAAGMAGQYKSFEVYTKLVPDIPGTVRKEPPLFIKNGNEKELQKNMSTDPTELSDWLFYSISKKHFNCAKLLFKAGVKIQPKHFYAAGKLTETDPIAARDFYQWLYAVETCMGADPELSRKKDNDSDRSPCKIQ